VFVVDASASMAWCFKEERSDASVALLRRCQRNGFLVPALWFLECSNTLLLAEKHGRLHASAVSESIGFLGSLAPTIDADVPLRAFDSTLRIARNFSLTTYDATYLELAIRMRLSLATRDGALERAARSAGVELIPA
jgi:predicted nucleic acid-binding protein